MGLYYVDTGVGAGIRESNSEESARVETLAEVGTMNGVKNVRKATIKDIVMVKAMNGWLPKSAIALIKTEKSSRFFTQ